MLSGGSSSRMKMRRFSDADGNKQSQAEPNKQSSRPAHHRTSLRLFMELITRLKAANRAKS